MSRRGRAAILAATMVFVATSLGPLYWALVASLTPEARIFGGPPLIPFPVVFDHYHALFVERAFWIPIRNSFIVAGATTMLAVSIGAPCAYAIARLQFRARTPLLAFVLAVSMFPQIALVSPLFLLLRALGLINTFPGLILPYLTFAMPLAIWFLVGFFRQLPAELEEAAMMDGAGRWRTLTEVVLPLAWPGLATTALITFLYSWNELLFALSFTLGPERHTVPVAIALFRGQYQVPWGQVFAAAAVTTAPLALVILFAQRRIIEGLTAGGVKG
jgi:ABC-type glycerol-3-phosphate transport system permease component